MNEELDAVLTELRAGAADRDADRPVRVGAVLAHQRERSRGWILRSVWRNFEVVALVLIVLTTSSCAAILGYYRFEVPVHATRLNVQDSSGALVKTINDVATIRSFETATERIDDWFDDIFGGPQTPEFQVEFFGEGWIGTLSIMPRRVHYIPGKGGAKMSSREHDELLRILGVAQPASGRKPGP